MSAFLKTKQRFLSAACLLLLVVPSASGWFFDPPSIDPDDPLETTGPFGVEKKPTDIVLDSETLVAELFVPIAPANENLYGMVLFMPGFGASFKAYEDYLNHLASHGYLAVGLDFSSPGFTTESFQDVKAQQALDAIAVVQALDPSYSSLPVITAGHSLGGKIAFYAASIDTSNTISGVMAMDPVNSGGAPCFISDDCLNYPVAPNVESGQRGVLHQMKNNTPSLIFRSKRDIFTNPDKQFNAQYFYYGSDGQGLDGAPSPSLYYDMGRFSHTAYVPLLCTNEVQLMKRTMVAWLQDQVQRIDRTNYLTGEIIEADVSSGYLDSVESR